MWASQRRSRPSDEDIYKQTTKDILDLVVSLRAQRYSFERIAAYMFENNHPSPYGRWNPVLIGVILKQHGAYTRPLYKTPNYEHIQFIKDLLDAGHTKAEVIEKLNSSGKRTVTGKLFNRNLLYVYLTQYELQKERLGDDIHKYIVPREDVYDI